MKKLIYVTLMAISLSLVFASCSKDDDKKEDDKKEDNKSLVGTVWVENDEGLITTLTFISETAVKFHAVEPSGKTYTETLTYTYNHPKVTFIWDDEEVEVGTITDNTLVFEDYVFTKK